jgi:predicted nucleic acid-binding protein
MPHAPLAVLDANVLFSFQLRNLLLHLAVAGRFEPLWSEEIMAECLRALGDDAGVSESQRAHLLEQMRIYFPGAWGGGHARAADGLLLPDEADRHVIALALHHEAEFIVTRNLRHFPADLLHPLGTEPVDPDEFVEILFVIDPDAVLATAEAHRRSLKAHPLDPSAYLESLRTHAGVPRAAELLRSAGFLDPAARRT